MDGIVTWILGTSINAWILNTPWAWPIMEILHFMGLSILLGSMLIIDIRLAGYWRGISSSRVGRARQPSTGNYGCSPKPAPRRSVPAITRKR